MLEHDPASETVIEYVPAINPEISSVVAALLQEYVNGETPLVVLTSIDPSDNPLPDTFVIAEVITMAAGAVKT